MRGSPSARVPARLLVACAVVAGLFAMHGLPEQTCADGADTGPSTSAWFAMPMSGRGPVQAAPVGAPSPATPAVERGTDGMGHGGVCVATAPSRGWADALALSLAGAFAVTAAAPAPSPERRRRRSSHRGPPATGAQLRTRLCVSRI
ncbi:hypothetical protein [Amycolatopsis benzoatilytica]|uniref:hypothetical protein n=1 Tax=Amycolatopsis benzoatilytica TaxID=346045 RepID=UPI000377F122|nr:hypothetical protein [Amycolatopsis benzoatilytica]